MDRDEELDETLRQLQQDPYIEKPDEMKPDLGGMCFLDRHRVCGADCTAFTDYKAPTAADRCTLLVAANAGLDILGQLVQLGRVKPQVPNIDPPYVTTQRGSR